MCSVLPYLFIGESIAQHSSVTPYDEDSEVELVPYEHQYWGWDLNYEEDIL